MINKYFPHCLQRTWFLSSITKFAQLRCSHLDAKDGERDIDRERDRGRERVGQREKKGGTINLHAYLPLKNKLRYWIW